MDLPTAAREIWLNTEYAATFNTAQLMYSAVGYMQS